LETITEKECLEIITAPLRVKKEGFRHLWVGYSGYGKTVDNARLIQYIEDTVPKCFLISTDQKNRVVLYPGEQIVLVDQLGQIEGQSAVIRGAATTKCADDEIDFEALATRVWNLARATSVPIVLAIDELFDACSSSQTWGPLARGKRKSEMDRLYRQGRVLGISLAVTTQVPQEIPRLAYAMSDTVCLFRMDGREIDYLHRLGIIDGEDANALQTFQIGDFLLCQKGQPKKRCAFSVDG
jgi:hypothetical protein